MAASRDARLLHVPFFVFRFPFQPLDAFEQREPTEQRSGRSAFLDPARCLRATVGDSARWRSPENARSSEAPIEPVVQPRALEGTSIGLAQLNKTARWRAHLHQGAYGKRMSSCANPIDPPRVAAPGGRCSRTVSVFLATSTPEASGGEFAHGLPSSSNCAGRCAVARTVWGAGEEDSVEGLRQTTRRTLGQGDVRARLVGGVPAGGNSARGRASGPRSSRPCTATRMRAARRRLGLTPPRLQGTNEPIADTHPNDTFAGGERKTMSPQRRLCSNRHMTSTRLFVFTVLATGCVRASPDALGDLHEGACRVDADCARGATCQESRAHYRSEGEIRGDVVTHFCAAASRDAG